MAPRALSAAAVLAVFSPAAAVQSKVVAHTAQQAGTRTQAQRVEQVLRSRTAQLKKALWDELGPVPEDYLTYDWADDARELLAQEADYLAAEDGYAASILHNYARSPFVPLLAMGFQPPMQAPPAFPDSFDGFQEEQGQEGEELRERVESRETTRRCRGGTCVLTTRTCSGRTCVTKQTVEEPEDQDAAIPEDEEWGMPVPLAQPGAAPEDQFAVIPEETVFGDDVASMAGPVDATVVIPPEVTDMVGDAMRVAARGLAKGLKEAAKSSGLPPLGDMLGKVMNSTLAKAKDVAKTLAAGNASNSQMDIVISGENMANAFKDIMGAFVPGGSNISKVFAPGSTLANAESVSTVTKVVNGKMVSEIKRCKKGQCTTTTEERCDGGCTSTTSGAR